MQKKKKGRDLEKRGTQNADICKDNRANREKKQLKLPAATGGRDLDPKALGSGKKPPEKPPEKTPEKKRNKVTVNTTPKIENVEGLLRNRRQKKLL